MNIKHGASIEPLSQRDVVKEIVVHLYLCCLCVCVSVGYVDCVCLSFLYFFLCLCCFRNCFDE